MNMYLPDYSYGNRMLVVARSEEVYDQFMKRGLDIMRITEHTIIFQPGNLEYPVTKIKSEHLNLLCDFDIVEISDTGLLYRAYANNESDSTVFLGAKCNSNCIMCPASDAERKKGFSYNRELLMKYIDYLPCNLEYIVMTGGEPTLQTGLFLEALERVKIKFPYTQVLLLTNGRSLSDRRFFEQVCERRPQNFRIAIPIHGDNAELHDKITQASGSFDQTILALRRLMNTEIDIEIRIVVTKANCNNLLGIAKLIVSHFPRVLCVNFIGLEPRGNCALNFDSVYIDHRDSFLKSKSAIDYLVSSGYDVGLYNYPLCAIDKDYWPICAKSISQYKNVYHPDCDRCDVKGICGGFFTATMSIAKPKVFPFVSEGRK